MQVLHSLLAISLLVVAPSGPGNAQDPIPQLRERAASSIAKIVGKGTTPAGREVPFEGSGVVIGSVQGISVILTAAHVVGKAGMWRATPNGDPDRELKVWLPRVPGGAPEPLALAPTVAAQNDIADFAILLIRGQYPGLAIGDPLQLAQSSQIVVMGYRLGAFTLALHVGRGQLVTRDALGFVLQLTDMQTTEGNSGGPVLGLDGRVLGILSGALRQATGQDLAVPITAAQSVLAAYLPPNNNNSREQEIIMEGSVRLELSGSGGGDFGRTISGEARLVNVIGAAGQSPKLGNDVAIAGRGSERSECKEDSGRTVSIAQASGSTLRATQDTLLFGVDLYAHGGHYRTAAACAFGEPVGLTGHDTMARAAATVQGSLRVPILDDRTRAIRITFANLPQIDAVIEVTDQEGNVVSRIRDRSSGDQEIAVERTGLYTVRLTTNPEVRAEGGSGEQRIRLNARIGVMRVPR